MSGELNSKVAVVAGGTRGAGRAIAIELGRSGATVYVTGRSTRSARSEMDRPETIEDTAEMVTDAGGNGIAMAVDHLDKTKVRGLAHQIEETHGQLDILVNDVWGGDIYLDWAKPVWEHSLDEGLRQLRLGIETHIVTSHYLLPLLIKQWGGLVVEMTDGTGEYNMDFRVGTSLYYDLVKTSVQRIALAQATELEPYGCSAIAVTPGWLRSEAMLDAFGVTEDNWRDATAQHPHFVISESPALVGKGVAALAADPEAGRWSGKTLSSGYLAQLYDLRDVDGSRPDAWRYITEVERPGKPADAAGYR